jgi:lysozyme
VILGCDISHWQGNPDFAAVRASGRDFVVLKATDGATVVDPQFATNRPRAREAGLLLGYYHLARAGDPAAEAHWFCGTVGDLADGEFVCLDWEVPGEPVGWSCAWLAEVQLRLGVVPLTYVNQSLRDGHDWSPVVATGSGLWLARYDGVTDAVGSGRWPVLAMKQYSKTGSIPGIAAAVDLDAFYGTLDQLRGYGRQGAPAPVPADDQPWTGLPTLHYGDRGAAVLSLQQFMTRVFPSYNPYSPTGNYLDLTAAGLEEFQHRTGIADGDGRTVGPRTNQQLWGFGYRG